VYGLGGSPWLIGDADCCAAICKVGRFGVELGSTTGEFSPPVFPLELTWLERSGVPSDGRVVVLARDDLVFVRRELLKRPSGTTRSFKTGISSTVPRLSTVA
jgi:hypothetical protein